MQTVRNKTKFVSAYAVKLQAKLKWEKKRLCSSEPKQTACLGCLDCYM